MTTCLLHPYFWDPGRRLAFLQDASDRFEIMCRDPRDPNLLALEANAVTIVGNDWHSRLDKVFVENLGKFRKYDGKSVQDLLRALRNKVRQHVSCFQTLTHGSPCRNIITKICLTMLSVISGVCRTAFSHTSRVAILVYFCMSTLLSRTPYYVRSLCSGLISSSLIHDRPWDIYHIH